MADRDQNWILALSGAINYCNKKITGGIDTITVSDIGNNTYLNFKMTDGTNFKVKLQGVLTDPQKQWVVDNYQKLVTNTDGQLEYDGKPLENVIIKNTKTDFPTTGKSNVLYISENDNVTYRWDNTTTSYIKLSGGSGMVIVDDYSQLPTTMTSDSIYFVKNSYEDTSVTPSATYSNGFYLWDNSETTPSWKLISSLGGIATYTDLGNVKIQLDGGIIVETDGEIHLEDFNKVDNGDGTVTITSGSGTYTKDTGSGEISNVSVGGLPVSSTTTTTSDGSGNTIETVVENVGGKETITTTTKDSSGGIISVDILETTGGMPTSHITTTHTSGTDGMGNPTSTVETVITDGTGGSSTHTVTETTDIGTGNKTTVDVTSTSSGGITKTETNTKEEDNTGTVASDTTDTTYEADQDLFCTKDDIDNSYDDIFLDLGW